MVLSGSDAIVLRLLLLALQMDWELLTTGRHRLKRQQRMMPEGHTLLK